MSGRRRQPPTIEWPAGYRAALTVFDDTDLETLDNGPVVYERLTQLGLFVTKSVWPLAATRPQFLGGSTCADPDYLAWVKGLQREGHEIGYHNATDHPSTRGETIEALDLFEEHFGCSPRVGADHAGNIEALYWGPRRLTGPFAMAYSVAQKVLRPNRPSFEGEVPDSPYFWGDVCRERVTYWRNFCFDEVNLLRVSPVMPYHDPRRDYVNYWFTSSDGSTRDRFLRYLTVESLDRLEADGGLCVMYTHFGSDFAIDGVLDPTFDEAVGRLAERAIWVAPVSTVLDRVREQLPDTLLTDIERRRLERRWILDRLKDSGFVRSIRR